MTLFEPVALVELPSLNSARFTFTFNVYGDPAAQGSKKAWVNPRTGRAQMREQAGAKLVNWRVAVAETAANVVEQPAESAYPLTGPLVVHATFRFACAKARQKRCTERGWLPKVSAPDLDKLMRSLGDGLKAGGLIHDDALIWSGTQRKVEVIGWTGAVVSIGWGQP